MASKFATTSKGKSIDMARLIAKNETVRAVGNMNVNARGDEIDASGRIIKSVNQRMAEKYANTVQQKTDPRDLLTDDDIDF